MRRTSIPAVPDASSARRVPRSTWVLLGVLLLLMGVATVLQFRRHRTNETDALHGDAEVASAALSDLLEKTPPAQRVTLLLKYVRDASPGLRYAAVDALGTQQAPATADAIEQAFRDSDSEVRKRALEVLPNVDPERGLLILLAGLRDTDSWIREDAATQLQLLARKHTFQHAGYAVPTLATALNDPDTAVVGMAISALRKLTGRPWHTTAQMSPEQKQAVIRRWQTWWQQERSRWKVPSRLADIAPISPTRTDPAPDFDLQDIDGRSIRMAAQHGRVTLLNFWGTWCPPCQQEIPDLVRLDRTYRSQNLDIIGIALNEKSAKDLRGWCRAHGVLYKQALATNAMQDAYGHIEEVPVSVLIDAQGRIRYRWEGERDFGTFSAAVERLLKEVQS